MFKSVEELTEIALEAREDFEDGAIPNDHLLEVARLYMLDQEENFRLSIELGIRSAFPLNHCELASAVLRHRVGYGRILLGGYMYDGGYMNANRRYIEGPGNIGYEAYAVLDVGFTALSKQTILDITADQYGGPEVYVGPFVEPWSALATL